MDRLIGIIRNGSALTARLARHSVAPDFKSREAVAQAAEAGAWYEIVECPLDTLEPALFSLKAPLLAAWDALGHVQQLTADVYAHLRLTLAETVLGKPSSEPLPPLALGQEPTRRVKPTAAHPRAYQGTTHKPPKEKLPAPVDLRPFLGDAKRLSFLPETEEAQLAGEARLPGLFRTSLYPLARCQSASDVSETLALYWALGLEADPARRVAAAYLFSLQRGQNTRDWCRFVAGLPEAWRTPLLHLLLASGAYAVPVRALPPSFVELLAEVLDGADPLYRAYWLLHGLTTGIAPDYLVAGYRLEDAYAKRQNHPFHQIRRSGYFPAQAVKRLWEYLASDADFYPGFALVLWQQCGERDGLGQLVETLDWEQYRSDIARRHLQLYSDYSWSDLTPEVTAAKWPVVLAQRSAVETLLHSVSEDYRRKCLLHLEEYLWQWDTPEELTANLPAAYLLTRRLCQPPFDKDSDPSEVTTDFLAELSLPLRDRFLGTPDASFRRLEEACRRENDTWLIGRGTYTLTRSLPGFSVRCFEGYPALLFKVAKLLGCLPLPVREAVVAPFRASPLFTQDLTAPSLADAAGLVEAHRDPDVFHPIPPKLREHLAGMRALPPVSLAHAAGQMRTQALRTGLEMLERAALRTLAEGFAVETGPESVKHALQMERLADDNRRALRKFLRAYWEGDACYSRDHPQARRWLAAHPRLNLEVWLRGVPHQQALDTFGTVSLMIEQDPLEALKLGTYVGSCLGLGGGFTHSAAAVVLDINKQVVYARDMRGTVLARQLVAVAEDDRLVCFSVYPLAVKPELETLFAEYGRLLSQALGLPIYEAAGDEDYEIAHILSHAWWDDSAWDLTVDA